ncbi:DUF1912 family protein [Streptococcus sp. zg-JUN1979]|uniref:DUF1912 family protein n=1 Tax=Streptococcus sp. zg-JUN1979 TaxID=3391450 RepID=UPI0039A51991
MTYQEAFLADLDDWLSSQITINELAMTEAQKIADEDKDERAREAYIRYESKLDAYRFLKGKMANYHDKKAFHDLPEGLFGERHY